MARRRPSRRLSLSDYYGGTIRGRLRRLLVEPLRPGRPAPGEQLRDRAHRILVLGGARLLLLGLFIDLVTGQFLPVTAFNVLLTVPIAVGLVLRRYGASHPLSAADRYDSRLRQALESPDDEDERL